MPELSNHPKALVHKRYEELLSYLSNLRFRRTPSESIEVREVPVVGAGVRADFDPFDKVAIGAAAAAGMPFIGNFDDGSRLVFNAIHTAMLTQLGDNKPDWIVANKKRTQSEMLFAIQYLRIAGQKGTVLESDLEQALLLAGHQVGTSIVEDKSINADGPDGFFRRGGKELGLKTEAFAVEAKAGTYAAANVIDGISKLKSLKNYSGNAKQKYRGYLADFVRGHYTADQFGTVLVALVPSMDPPNAGIPGNWKLYFDAAVIINVWGKTRTFKG